MKVIICDDQAIVRDGLEMLPKMEQISLLLAPTMTNGCLMP